MSTFIHNEPTCLGVIQEAGLPEAFYRVVESGLEPIIEVFAIFLVYISSHLCRFRSYKLCRMLSARCA